MDMQSFKFPAGTTVHVSRRSLTGQSVAGMFKVTARYTSESSGPIYRVRSATGPEERMVPEYELAMSQQQVVDDVFRPKRVGPRIR